MVTDAMRGAGFVIVETEPKGPTPFPLNKQEAEDVRDMLCKYLGPPRELPAPVVTPETTITATPPSA